MAANHPPQPVVSGRLNEIQRTSARIEAMETASCFADFSPGHESPGILFHGLNRPCAPSCTPPRQTRERTRPGSQSETRWYRPRLLRAKYCRSITGCHLLVATAQQASSIRPILRRHRTGEYACRHGHNHYLRRSRRFGDMRASCREPVRPPALRLLGQLAAVHKGERISMRSCGVLLSA